MKTVKGILAIFLLLAMLVGCSRTAPEQMGGLTTAPDLFTTPAVTTPEPTTAPEETDPAQPPKTTYDPNLLPQINSYGIRGTEKDEQGRYFRYTGGEMQVTLLAQTSEMGPNGIGFMLFVDGIPQPYRMTENQEYAYMHTVYPNEFGVIPETHDVYFIPVTGEKGQTLEFAVQCIMAPDYRMDRPLIPFAFASMGATSTRMIFEATPEDCPQVEAYREVTDVVLTYVDAAYKDMGNWSAEDLQRKTDYNFRITGVTYNAVGNVAYNVSRDSVLEVELELFGTPLASYSFVLLVNNQPVYLSADVSMAMPIESGKKTVLTCKLPLTNMDDDTVIYGILVTRNFWTCAGLHDSNTRGIEDKFYFTKSQEEVLWWK